MGGCALKLSLLRPYEQTELSIGLNTKGTVECNIMYIPQNTFGNLMKRCVETKSLYIDKDFGANMASISSDNFLRSKGVDPSLISKYKIINQC